MFYFPWIEYFYSIHGKGIVVVLQWFLILMNMRRPEVIPFSMEEQKVLFMYYDTVLMDFDAVSELKKVKSRLKKAIKKPGNK
jgi:hypothetical protein